MEMNDFITQVWAEGRAHYRNLPWRNIDDPYVVLTSEVMLQQTQVARVQQRWDDWMQTFPCVEDLAAAPLSFVLEKWQGMGYNRRALNLKRTAELICSDYDGVVPQNKETLLALPGVGPSTAAGVRIFAFKLTDIYIETNVRTVFLHELFPQEDGVSDKELTPYVQQAAQLAAKLRGYTEEEKHACVSKVWHAQDKEKGCEHSDKEQARRQAGKDLCMQVGEGQGTQTKASCCGFASGEDQSVAQLGDDIRAWYYALLDYGAYLKSILPNPSRRSKHYARQSTFEGSHRQKRSFLLREVLAGLSSFDELSCVLNNFEDNKAIQKSSTGDCLALLQELERDGFLAQENGKWFVL